MKLIKENTTRKVDTLGRVSIPKGMRDRLNIKDGEEMDFYLLEDDYGNQYVALAKQIEDNNKYIVAANVLRELSLEVPEKLEELI
jgi:AbrB family looped-hinge helix DNA binding protein